MAKFFSVVPPNTNTTLGGNLRGDSSIDLQFSRTALDQVASGEFSAILGGENNKVTGQYAIVVSGVGNLASGNYSIASGISNSSSGVSSATIGSYNTASGFGAAAIGYGNIAGGISSLAIGRANIANADYSAVYNGESSRINPTGINTIIVGGKNAEGYIPGSIVTGADDRYDCNYLPSGIKGYTQQMEALLYKRELISVVPVAAPTITVTLDGNSPTVLNQLSMATLTHPFRSWHVVIDYMLTQFNLVTNTCEVMSGKTLVVMTRGKQGTLVPPVAADPNYRKGFTTTISEIGDSTIKSNWNFVAEVVTTGTAAPDLILKFVPAAPFSIAAGSEFKASAKVSILQITNPII